jgi:hypothetical protein
MVLAVVLPAIAVASSGLPWRFRGHPAALVETVGTVEFTFADNDKEASNVRALPGDRLDKGDVVRVARLSEARLRTPTGDVALHDATTAVLTATAVQLRIGVATAFGAKESPQGAVVGLEGLGTVTTAGEAHIAHDGSAAVVAAISGDATVTQTSGAVVQVAAGTSVRLDRNTVSTAQIRPTDAFKVTASCSTGRVEVRSSAALQAFVGGKPMLLLRDNAQAAVLDDANQKEAVVFARDLFGRTSLQTVSCVPPPPPAKR